MKSILLLTALSLGMPLLHAADLTARLDRDGLSQNETVELILETADPTQFGKPDLAPLRQDFTVLAVRQNSAPRGAEAVTRWNVTLQPKRTGTLTIPSLALGDARSAPLRLDIRPQPTAKALHSPIYIEAETDRTSLYVQAETQLTVRLYHSVALYDDNVITPPTPLDARVDALGPPRVYERDIDGIRHGVIEWRYAVHPLQSGTLVLPTQTFSATLAASAGDAGRAGQPIQVRTHPISLEVKPQPASYPAQAPWLPARQLTLTQSWNPQPDQAHEGAALTRTLHVRAAGLAASQLPPLVLPEVAGLRRYAEQPRLNVQIDEHGLIGTREERMALIPATSGERLLPPVELVWWNTETDTLERATLTPQTLRIAADQTLHPVAPIATVKQALTTTLLWPWQLACAVLTLTTVLGFGLWWRARRQPAIASAPPTDANSRGLRDDLRRACQSNDPHATRQALDAWARQQPETLAVMGARFEPLAAALDDLNGALYSEAGQRWQGETLWQAITALPSNQPVTPQESLPPLYPR